MNKTLLRILFAISALFLFHSVPGIFAETGHPPTISGFLQDGYRVLPFNSQEKDIHYTVYRGDYIKFEVDEKFGNSLLEIPSLQISKNLTSDLATAPYFKMKKAGSYLFRINEVEGWLEVVEYEGARYQKLTSAEAAQLISSNSPIILDVRTPREYKAGHLQNSILIPVQELQQRYTELLQYKDEDVFIYCATGNRSTVASKILIDRGFNHIFNLEKGIYDWAQKGHPVTR